MAPAPLEGDALENASDTAADAINGRDAAAHETANQPQLDVAKRIAMGTELGQLTPAERWQLRGVILSAVRWRSLMQRQELMHRPVGPAVDARSTQQQQQHVVHEPEDFWGGIAFSLASLGGGDARAEEAARSVVAVAQEAASHRWRVARFSTTFSSPARLMHESQCRRIMMQDGGGDVLTSVERRDQAEVLIRWQQGDEVRLCDTPPAEACTWARAWACACTCMYTWWQQADEACLCDTLPD